MNRRWSPYWEKFDFNMSLSVIQNIFNICGPLNNETLPWVPVKGNWRIHRKSTIKHRKYFHSMGSHLTTSAWLQNYLQKQFSDYWIGTNGPSMYLAQSHDLTPLAFFIWGYLKNQIYAIPLITLEDLGVKVRAAGDIITLRQLNNIFLASSYISS